MFDFFELMSKFVKENANEDAELTGMEIAQIAMRVADAALEAYGDKKITPEEIWSLLQKAYEEFVKESND